MKKSFVANRNFAGLLVQYERATRRNELWSSRERSDLALALADAYRRLGDVEGAARVLERDLGRSPDPNVARLLADARFELDNPAGAARALERGFGSDPQDGHVLLRGSSRG